MLTEVQDSKDSSVVSFLPHGRAFVVHDNKRFIKEVLPKYFSHGTWLSFTRQLSLYGFRRINDRSCPDVGAYYHELFLRGHKGLSLHMRRVGVPPPKKCNSREGSIKPKVKLVDHRPPNFYSLTELK
jgi:hypothetical protein